MTTKPRRGIRCLQCGEAVYSKYTHDFRRCKCGAVAVDGGSSYLRIIGDFTDWVVIDEKGLAVDPLESLD